MNTMPIRLKLAISGLIILVALLGVVGMAYADVHNTPLATFTLEGYIGLKTRATHSYEDHNSEGITMGRSYIYAKATEGCYYTRLLKLQSGETYYGQGEYMNPPLCAGNDETYTFSLFDGQRYSNTALNQTVLYTRVNSNLGYDDATAMGWDTHFGHDHVEIVDECRGLIPSRREC